ncbi:(2Fe-2S)-binding protein [Cyclobacterium qasimii]|uniref:Isoquinoline 1-oxidoreductase alpha subunit n=2 Tax=Cyclobacterium qasimii TaxID=1350429 RepID=S7V8X7_9BACT|nr:(2Fe-2S)-binding protein [Cyclobacterium qasimii]EPR66690.1 Isoquinoline 1-oxidoreductase alpha subunit [Cyclobacterium qasimii M12-11B]GEO23382.1 (2Fe-2S)-binding protein [Cyclobacterium qasimii]
MKLRVNNKEYSVEVANNPSLLEVLRDKLDLTGTKYGCGEGACGACKVLVNGIPTPSCITPVTSVSGKKVITIEGLAENGELHPVQKVFLEEDVFQCSYCAPGMVITAAALLKKQPDASTQDLIDGLNGNICRCCTYPAIINALKKIIQKEGEQ